MAEKFDLAKLEQCLGGSLPAADAFNMQTYGFRMQVLSSSISLPSDASCWEQE